MPNQSGKIVLVLVLLLLILGFVVYFFLPSFKEQEHIEQIPRTLETTSQRKSGLLSTMKKYSSEDLKISFEYPDNWFVNEKNYFLIMTSYATKIGRNEQPTNSQIEVAIHKPGGCHATIDENLKDPSCGEEGQDVKLNEIVSKETEDLNGIKFHKYIIKYPSGKEQRFYFLEKGDRILQIDKNPDPSMFEKEFEETVKSIKFLDQ